MRTRGGLFTLLAAGAIVAATAVPASAGTGASQACSDGIGYQEIPVHNGVVTVGAELGWSPDRNQNNLIICFSNTVPGVPSTATGGALWVFYGVNPSTGAPSVYANLYCDDDLGPQTIDLASPPFSHCDYDNGVSINFGTSLTVLSPGCLVFSPLNGSCLYFHPTPVAVPLPTISVTVMNVRVL